MKMRVLGLLLCAALLTGCGTDSSLSSLPSEEPYSGFGLLPQQDTPDLAYQRGALVQEDFQTTKGAEHLNAFLRKTASGQPATLQIASFYETDQSQQVAYLDIVYREGRYQAYRSDAPDQSPRAYRLLRTVSGRLPNAARDGTACILTDSDSLTYNQVMMCFLSSDSEYCRSVPPFEYLFSD